MNKRAKPVLSRWAKFIYTAINSPKFIYFILILFILQATWIAISARYPMPFDEHFHLGIIKLYTHQKGPFFSTQPAGADTLGAVARDPSYLYHYLMNFPDRLITHLSHSFIVEIIFLRLINVLLLASSIVIFRLVLLRSGASRAISHTVLLFTVVLPVVPLLGAQINYDNLLIPLSALAVLWTIDVWQALQKGRLRLRLLIGLLTLCMLNSLVKYAFLPIFAAIIGILLVALVKRRKQLWPMFIVQLTKGNRIILIILALLLLGSFGLFFERYGINTLRYHTPIPECDQVLSVQHCQAYSPWARNYEFLQAQPHVAWWSLFRYIGTWVRLTLTETVFTITSHFHPDGIGVDYYNLPPLPVVYDMAWLFFALSSAAVIVSFRRIWANGVLRICMIISAVYLLVLWFQNFMDYKHLGQPIAIHGRYLLPVLPLIFLMSIQALAHLWHHLARKHPTITDTRPLLVAAVMIIFFFEGGGFTSFIVLSRDDWFWPHMYNLQHANSSIRRALRPVVIGD